MSARRYVCHKCGVGGVKLWRDYGMPFHWDLWCVDCACARTGGTYSSEAVDPATIRPDGTRVTETHFFDTGTRAMLIAFKGAVPPCETTAKHVERRDAITDTIGWRSPAIPVEAADKNTHPDAYWGYSSWSEENDKDFVWWQEQPLRRETPA